MNYQTVTTSSDKCSSDLEVIDVNTNRGIVKLRSKNKDLSVAHQQLQSEDAKSLAMRAAVKEGIYEPAIKHATLQYGDDKTGVAANHSVTSPPKNFRPFMVIEFISPTTADMQFTGDSL